MPPGSRALTEGRTELEGDLGRFRAVLFPFASSKPAATFLAPHPPPPVRPRIPQDVKTSRCQKKGEKQAAERATTSSPTEQRGARDKMG